MDLSVLRNADKYSCRYEVLFRVVFKKKHYNYTAKNILGLTFTIGIPLISLDSNFKPKITLKMKAIQNIFLTWFNVGYHFRECIKIKADIWQKLQTT